MALYPEDQEWRDIAKQISMEVDPAQLTILVGKLCHALDERNERKPQAQYLFPADYPKSQGEYPGSATLIREQILIS